MDLKAAFDNIRREKLWSIIEEIEIEKHTIRRVKRMYEDTRVTIRTEDGLTSDGSFQYEERSKTGICDEPTAF